MMIGTVKVRVACPGCGPVVLPAKALRCELEAAGDKGICELRCPVCSTMVLVPAGPVAVETMRDGGAGHMIGSVPFELLEPHSGPPLSWDDVLDFKLALDSGQDFFSNIGEI
jgi:DNA-directed RNA polymerase subunit RPC12/RpoP